jgi:hypothetical protein
VVVGKNCRCRAARGGGGVSALKIVDVPDIESSKVRAGVACAKQEERQAGGGGRRVCWGVDTEVS